MTAFPHIFQDGVGETASGKQVMENLEVLKEAIDGTPWTAITLGAKLEEYLEASWTARCRLEDGGANVRLRGTLAVKAAMALAAGETLLTLPVGYRPSATVLCITDNNPSKALTLTIPSTGVCILSQTVEPPQPIVLNGLSFNVT